MKKTTQPAAQAQDSAAEITSPSVHFAYQGAPREMTLGQPDLRATFQAPAPAPASDAPRRGTQGARL